jgi:outer membrane protein, heavy metal efflux system
LSFGINIQVVLYALKVHDSMLLTTSILVTTLPQKKRLNAFQPKQALKTFAIFSACSLGWLLTTSTSSLASTAALSGTVTTSIPNAAATQSIQKLSIDDIVTIVLQQNSNLKAARSSTESARASIQTAGAIPNPRIETFSGNNRSLLPGVTGGRLTGQAVSQFIDNPFLRSARVDSANFGFETSQQAFTATRNELIAQTRAKAYELLLRKEEERAAFDALTLLEQIRVRVKIRVDSGEAARYELIKADAEVVNARQKYQTAKLFAEQAILTLNRLAAGQLPAKWQLKENLNDPIETPSLAQTLSSAQAQNPELKLLAAEVNQRAARLREAKQSRLPGVELRYAQMNDPEIRQNALNASIQIPLFDQRTGPVGQAAADLNRALQVQEGRRIDLEQQINAAWKSLQIARIRVNALSTGAVTEATAALRVAEAAYRFGERGILDVLDAQRLLRNVNADLLDARFQYQLANIELQLLSGLDSSRPTTSP